MPSLCLCASECVIIVFKMNGRTHCAVTDLICTLTSLKVCSIPITDGLCFSCKYGVLNKFWILSEVKMLYETSKSFTNSIYKLNVTKQDQKTAQYKANSLRIKYLPIFFFNIITGTRNYILRLDILLNFFVAKYL